MGHKLGFIIIFSLSFLGSIASFLFGGWDKLLSILLACVVLDYITGFIAAAVERKLSSKVGFRGIAQKIIIFALVAVANLIDKVLGYQFIRDWTVLFYIINEVLSIIENAGRVGLPVPAFILHYVELLRNRIKK